MEIGMKAFYQQPKQARRAMNMLTQKGLHIKKIHYYKKNIGDVENFNARGNVARKIGRAFVYGASIGFVTGCIIGFILISFSILEPFQGMNAFGTVIAIGVIGAFTIPAFTTVLAAVFSEDKVDIDESDFNGDQVVVDFHVELKEKEQAEELLRESGAHNVLYE